MIYLWGIPLVILILLVLWGFWHSVSKRNGPPEE
jgi:hypothetical protein